MAGAVGELLRDTDRANAMGAAGAALVHRDLTWDHLADKLQLLLAECINRRLAAS